MSVHVFTSEQRVAHPLEQVFGFFSRAANLELITPPWLQFSILGDEPGEVSIGTVIPYRLRLHGLPLTWVSQIDQFEQNRMFVDRQLVGPYRLWVHTHEFRRDDDQTVIRDEVRYELPLGALGEITHALVHRDIERIFAFRREAIEPALRDVLASR